VMLYPRHLESPGDAKSWRCIGRGIRALGDSGSGPPPTPADQSGLQLADIEDKLVEKREKLAYFIITASAALIAFTFNNLNSPNDVLRKAPLCLLLVGWALLLLAAAVSLFIIRKRHTTYAEVIDEIRGRAKVPSETSVIGYRRSMRLLEAVTMALFFAGFVVLAVAHAIALTRAGA
jgi:hypothetical protein